MSRGAGRKTTALHRLVLALHEIELRAVRVSGILSSVAEARALQSDWRELWERTDAALAFNHPDWLLPWWPTLGSDGEPYLVVARQGDQLEGVAALARYQTPLGPVMRPAGEGVSDYTDWLLPDEPQQHAPVLENLAGSIAADPSWIGIELSGWRSDSDARRLSKTFRKHGLATRVLPGLACPFVSMPNGFDAYYRSRGSQTRYNVRSRERRLGEHGRVHYEHASAEEAPRMLEEAMILHARRWQGQRTSTVFSSSPTGRSFYRGSIPSAVRQGFADLALLKLDERVIASAIGFHHAQEFSYYMPAWDPMYQRYAPSTLLIVHLMQHASARGSTRFDFMLGDEPYKAQWATSEARVHTVIANRTHPAGRVWRGKTLMQLALKERARASSRLRAIRRYGLSAVLGPTDRNR
jgi:CelD/BcsL family acetyltransferase involved in cellulose biosynthesis